MYLNYVQTVISWRPHSLAYVYDQPCFYDVDMGNLLWSPIIIPMDRYGEKHTNHHVSTSWFSHEPDSS